MMTRRDREDGEERNLLRVQYTASTIPLFGNFFSCLKWMPFQKFKYSSSLLWIHNGHNKRDDQNIPTSVGKLSQSVKYPQKGSPEFYFTLTHL
jgi:hypothetical protein